ncbi:MAG: hypothetical protein B7Z78_04280 [Rhodospirillales bacterium 20-60-12]|nr:MAG: hypothetical protein B7Z78_04280 [Rhodospirillales bacterium 20-60-12]HQT68255.1 hypothetical protein [Acetobacteraceae bacterium]HQU00907.1 hypothetical protein [Acetobacteraceae bacterium]
MNDVKDIIKEFINLLSAENAALRAGDFSKPASFLVEKAALAARFSALPPEQQSSAGDFDRLEPLIQQNRLLLESAIDTQSRVISTVLSACEKPLAQSYRQGAPRPLAMRPVAFSAQA